jgi:hypothetical protein
MHSMSANAGTSGSSQPSPKASWHPPEENERDREKERDRERDRERGEREREREWERQRERDRDRDREREGERDSSYRLAGPPSGLSSSGPPGYQNPQEGMRSPSHRYTSSGHSTTMPITGQQGPIQNPPVSHSPPRSRQVPLSTHNI